MYIVTCVWEKVHLMTPCRDGDVHSNACKEEEIQTHMSRAGQVQGDAWKGEDVQTHISREEDVLG